MLYLINGSPRKNGNTAEILQHVLAGIQSKGREGEIIHLYDYHYQGCISCFSCKRLGGPSFGKCAVQDELTPVLAKLKDAEAMVLGTPFYLNNMSSGMVAFLERFNYPYLHYDLENPSSYGRTIPCAFVYTMNVGKEEMDARGLAPHFHTLRLHTQMILGSEPKVQYVHDTYQFSDYSKFEAGRFLEEDKSRVRAEQFPIDCKKAFALGESLAEEVRAAE